MDIQDIISISSGLLYIIPFILYIISNNYIHIQALLGTISATFLSEGLKYFLIKDKSPRPKGAKDCNLLCNDGNQEGRPGMPSSHSATVAFFSGFYFQHTENIIIRYLLVIYAGLVMLSRYIKRCHTFNQIVVGGILGLSLSWIVVRKL
jgi:membrane-associated phospholipid phosphatase